MLVAQAIVSLDAVYARSPSTLPPPSSAVIVFVSFATSTVPFATLVSPVPP